MLDWNDPIASFQDNVAPYTEADESHSAAPAPIVTKSLLSTSLAPVRVEDKRIVNGKGDIN